MKFKSTVLSALMLAAVGLSANSTALAQTTRAAVKAEAAASAGTQPTGQMSVPNQDRGTKPAPSAVSRESVKEGVADARAAGTLTTGGQTSGSQGKKPPVRTGSVESRAAVKAEAASAAKDGGLSPGKAAERARDKEAGKP